MTEPPIVVFTVDGPPVPWQRAGTGPGGKRYTQPESAAYRRLLASLATLHRGAGWPLNARYELTVHVTFADERRRDLDNVAKQVMDACNGILWADDSQIDAIGVVRGEPDKATPRLRVTVTVMPDQKAPRKQARPKNRQG